MKKKAFILFFIILCSSVIYLWWQSRHSGFSSYPPDTKEMEEVLRIRAIQDRVFRSGIKNWQVLLHGQISLDEFQKIDFSLPGTPGFGQNPEYEFFNPQGRFKAQPLDIEYHDLRPFFVVYQFITVSSYGDPAGLHTQLYVVLSLPDEMCVGAQLDHDIPRDNQTIVITNGPRSTINSPDGCKYFYGLAGDSRFLETP
ncbi:MAG: hypothetical protein JNM12_11955 [Alphaproteobacteria bacterium]|nr:hypothetical protein [Alphaproteobacteria bacterium]